MCTIVIVEDSPWIRKGLAAKIPWTDLGFSLIGQAVDGNDGQDLIMRLNPQFALVDIMMPEKDGFAMIESLKNNAQIQTQYIIMSGHNEFQLTRKAIKIGVCDYILKPIKEKDLIDLLKNIKKKAAHTAGEDFLQTLPRMESLDPTFREFLSQYRSPQSTSDALLLYTLRRMEEIYASNVSLKDICSEIQVSESNLSRRFKHGLGFTFVEYLNRMRVWHAARHFADPMMRIGEVAELVGIADQRYFAVLFKKMTGLTPTQFRAGVVGGATIPK